MNNSGRLAEMKAANYMREKGYTLLEHSFHSRFGEIDLICENHENIVFVEVKARSDGSIAAPREFVDDNKQKKIIATSGVYLANNPTNLQPRYDVVEIYLDEYKIKSIKHLENAFTL